MNGEFVFRKVKILFWVSVMMCILCLDFVSCKNKPVPTDYQNKNTPVKEFIFSITEFNINGECDYQNPEKYYVSKNAVRFLNMHFFDRGKILTVSDIYFPYKKGYFESHGFYDASCDKGDWVEDCLISYEEKRLAEVFEKSIEIDSPLEGIDDDFDFLSDYDYTADLHVDLSEDVIVETGDESEKGKSDSVEKRLLDSKARLRMLMFEDEIFIPETRSGEQILISSDGKKVRRSFYDDKFRLLKREHWNITDLKTSKVVRLEEYGYNSTSLSAVEKSITTDDTTIRTYFNDNGAAYKSETYKIAVIKNTDKKSIGGKSEADADSGETKVQYIKSSVEWKYNSEGKLTSESTANYEYSDEDYKTASKIYRKRQVYAYHDDEEIPPDYQYFENGKLRMRTVYASKDEYRTDTIFDSNYTVRTYYADGKKIRDIYYQNGRATRVRNYE